MKPSIFELSSLTLIDIIKNDMLFRVAIKSAIRNYKLNTNEEISALSTILGANLRHYYLLEEILKYEFNEIEGDEKYYYSIIISDALFSKKIDYKLVEKWEKKQESLNLPKGKLKEIYDKYWNSVSFPSL